MTIETLVAFNIALLAALASPGPALLVAIRTTLQSGRVAGVAIGAGLALVAAGWTTSALLGLEIVFQLFPWAYVLVKTCGALYLMYVAINMWLQARQRIDTTAKPAKHAFRQGVMINLLNPKSVLFAAAVLVVIFPSNMTFGQSAFVVANHFAVEMIFYTVLAFGMSTDAVSQRYMQAKVYIDRSSAVILGLLGLRLITDR